MRVSPLQSYCANMCEREKGHVWIVSLYIGLQAVFIIFHYSCFMHDCARRAVISSVGVEANQRVEKVSKLRHADGPTKPQMSRPLHISHKKKRNILWKLNHNITESLQSVLIFQNRRDVCQRGLTLVRVWNFCFLCFQYEQFVCPRVRWESKQRSKMNRGYCLKLSCKSESIFCMRN